MHRSGTSLVSQLLHEAGFDFGDAKLFYPADQWNVKGYIEAAPIIDLNSIFITGVPRTKSRFHSFLSQCVYMMMPDPARIYRRGLKYSRDIRQMGRIYDKLAVKDPRFCLTLPLWNEFAHIEKVVVCTRHPYGVARSLKHRQMLPRSLYLAFWSYHIRSLLMHLPMEKTCFIDVDKLFTGEGLDDFSKVLRFLEVDTCRVEPQDILDKVFRKSLVHNKVRTQSNLPDEVQALWEQITDIAQQRNRRYYNEFHNNNDGKIKGL